MTEQIGKDFNPSVRGTKRSITRIIRCPKKKKKVSLYECKHCQDFNGIQQDSIICNYKKGKRPWDKE